jgi:hypothetical protein
MRVPGFARNWPRRPSRIALLLGLGALSVAGARTEAAKLGPVDVPPETGDALIRDLDGKIFLAERGGEFRELRLQSTAEAEMLKQLLRSRIGGTAAIPLHSTILAGAGGEAFHWAPADDARAPQKGTTAPAAQTPAKAGSKADPKKFRPTRSDASGRTG